MNQQLREHLWRSPDFREALKKEIYKLLCFGFFFILAIVAFRYLTDKPIAEGFYSALIGVFGILIAWVVSALRTIHDVLKEHNLD